LIDVFTCVMYALVSYHAREFISVARAFDQRIGLTFDV